MIKWVGWENSKNSLRGWPKYASLGAVRTLVSSGGKYLAILDMGNGRYQLRNSAYSGGQVHGGPLALLGEFPSEDEAKFAAELIRG